MSHSDGTTILVSPALHGIVKPRKVVIVFGDEHDSSHGTHAGDGNNSEPTTAGSIFDFIGSAERLMIGPEIDQPLASLHEDWVVK